MTCNLPAMKKTFARQSTAGNVAIIALAIYILYPYLMDRYRGEPAISSTLTVEYYDGNSYIHELTKVKFPNRGSRNNVLYDREDRVICSKNFNSFWDADRNSVWSIHAFADCVSDLAGEYRACSIFNIHSKGGIDRKFGGDKSICTEFFTIQGKV